MATPITIAIAGATTEKGRALSLSLSTTAYRLLLLSQRVEALENLISEIIAAGASNAEAVDCTIDACWEADIIFLAVPGNEENEIACRIKEVATGKIVVSLSAPQNRSDDAGNQATAATSLETLLAHSKIIRAFYGIDAGDFVKTAEAKKTVDVFIAGTDEEALQDVRKIASSMGFHSIKMERLSSQQFAGTQAPVLDRIHNEKRKS